MKAQQVKNTVIVPNGAKGGFVCKQLPAGDRDAIQREVVACYQTFVRGCSTSPTTSSTARSSRLRACCARTKTILISSSRPTRAPRRSPTSRTRLSAEYSFWLGDAFASGGSAGYDHKKMAITARGAWEAVKRHFRELGVDSAKQDFTVVGIGDMSGDVFGNGVLLSPHIKLVAAFDHRHIFIDPESRPRDELRRAPAHVRAAALELGRLRPREALRRRRHLLAPDEVDRAARQRRRRCSDLRERDA